MLAVLAAAGSGAASLQNLLQQGGLNAGGRYSGIERDADGNPTGQKGSDITGVINAAATDESTPPDMPTTMRSVIRSA